MFTPVGKYKRRNKMNWFGIFTMGFTATLIVAVFAHAFGYEKAERDMRMSREWVMRNHPTNGDWK
jgi:type III secretory pathway component EscU